LHIKIPPQFQDIPRNKKLLLLAAAALLIASLIWEAVCKTDENESDTVIKEASSQTLGTSAQYMEEYIKMQENRLKSILSRIDGAGEIYVMITAKKGTSKDILKDTSINYEDTTEIDSAGGERKIYTYSENTQTIYVTDENGNTYPYVLSENAPEIEGVAVVTSGNVSATVRQKIINVIKALFDIEINKISVE
jgi:stage III sporulation protein AG